MRVREDLFSAEIFTERALAHTGNVTGNMRRETTSTETEARRKKKSTPNAMTNV